MNKIDKNLTQFIRSIVKGLPVSCNSLGEFYIEGRFKNLFRRLETLKESQIISVARGLIKALDSLESISVQFGTKAANIEIFVHAIHAVKIVLASLSERTSEEVVKISNRLTRRLVGLRYRIEGVHGGLDPEETKKSLREALVEKARGWKESQKLIVYKALTDKDLVKISQAATYVEFAELLLKDSDLLESFFVWILRDKNAVAPFIEYPALQIKIHSSALSGRIGRINGDFLKISKVVGTNGSVQKIVTLPFEGKPQNILDEKAVIELRGNYKLTVAQVFEVFKNKFARVGNLEFLAEGVVNWNVHHLGWWDADKKSIQKIDLNKSGWWRQLPLFEVLTKEEAQMRYGAQIDGVVWAAAATAARGNPTLDVDKNHAFLEVAIPSETGHYVIYDFGKFAYEFPTTFFENISIFCKNVHATIAFPDENVYYSHRQQVQHPFILEPDQGIQLMKKIKKDIELSRGKNFVFQIESENCAKWVHETLAASIGEGRMPNLYRISLLDTEPVGLVRAIFDLIKKLPNSLQTPVLTALHIPFGAATGTWVVEDGKKVLKSMINHHFWRTTEIYLPAFLHKQKEAGLLATSAADVYTLANNRSLTGEILPCKAESYLLRP